MGVYLGNALLLGERFPLLIRGLPLGGRQAEDWFAELKVDTGIHFD
jgi:hypothetical protein